MQRRRLAMLLVATLIAASAAVLGGPSAAQADPYTPIPTNLNPEVGPFYMKNYHSGKCLDVPGQSMANSVGLDQWTCVNQTNVKWSLRFAYWTTTGQRIWATFRIVNNHSGKCLTVPGSSKTDGQRLVQYTCKSYGGDLDKAGNDVWWWILIDGLPMLQNSMSLRCIDVAGASMSNGAPVDQWTCVQGYYASNRGWNMVPA